MTVTRSIRQQRSPLAAFLNYGVRKTLHKGWVRALAALPLPRAQDVVTSRYGVKLRANWRDRTFQYCRAATYGRDLSGFLAAQDSRSEEHTSELQSLMRLSYAAFCLKNKRY